MVWPFSLLRRKKKAPPALGAVLDSDRHHKGLTCIPGVGAVDLEHTIKGDHAPSTVTSGAGGARADAENAELQRSTLAPDLAPGAPCCARGGRGAAPEPAEAPGQPQFPPPGAEYTQTGRICAGRREANEGRRRRSALS